MADERDPRDDVIEGEFRAKDEEPRKTDLAMLDTSVIGGLTRAEIDVQIATAHKFPRSITKVQRTIQTYATLDVETATATFFRKPQKVTVKDPKTGRERLEDGHLEGPSIRFAEIVMQAWGNGRVASRVTDQTETEIEATGIFHDLESNVAWAKSVRVPIIGSKGNRYPAHLITTTGNAAAAKAIRNAILAGVPRGVWAPGYAEAQKVSKGTAATLPDRRKKMLARAAEDGLVPDQVFAILGVKGEADITIDILFDAASLLTALRDGEATLEELIARHQPEMDERGLNEAFGKQQPKKDPPKAAPAAPTAAPAKDTSASATAASGPSAEETSGPKAPAEPSKGGETATHDHAAAEGDAGQELAEPAQADNVVNLGERRATDAAEEMVTEDGEVVDTREFNAFASAVQSTATWPDFKAAVTGFRDSPAFAAAPEDLRRQAMLLAHSHWSQKGSSLPPEGDVTWYRLWLWTLDWPSTEARPAFRKMVRGGQYRDDLTEDERNAVVDETNRASGD